MGADNAPLGAVMGTRGDVGAVASASVSGTGFSSRGMTTGAAAASETPTGETAARCTVHQPWVVPPVTVS